MKILYVTTISLTVNTFFKPHIEMLFNEGHCVDIACNFDGLEPDELFCQLGCNFHQVDFSRSPLSSKNIKAYGQLKKIIEQGNYDIVHCHTPNAAVITRLVCRKFRKKSGLKVFYTAHGFHFYKGAPILNWMIFYPIEKLCSRYTDKLITINKEDYELAKAKFKAKEVHYIPGVGIDLSRLENLSVDRKAKREEIGVPQNAFLLFSVGELNKNKNHQIVVKAMARLKNPNVHYAIAGVGNQKDRLLKLSSKLGVADRVHLLGYRNDISELNCSADAFCFPSFREGLSVSLMEAMACGLPCVVSRIRGNVDLVKEGGGEHFSPNGVDECAAALKTALNGNAFAMSKINKEHVEKFSIDSIIATIKNLYES